MNFYQSLGPLILGSRLRRLSEYYIMEINKVYQCQGIDFDASWFPVFYILSEHERVSIREIADATQTSHSAVSQLVSNLKRRGLLETANCETDNRRQLVALTEKGHDLLRDIKPIWGGIQASMLELLGQSPASQALLPAVTALEVQFSETSFADRIESKLKINQNDETSMSLTLTR